MRNLIMTSKNDEIDLDNPGRRTWWVQHLIGFASGIVISYSLSYFTALWVASITVWSVDGYNPRSAMFLILSGVAAGIIIGVVQSRLLIKAGFIAAIAVVFIAGLAAGMSATFPLSYGITDPLNFAHFLANAGSNPGTVTVFVAASVQAGIIHLSRRRGDPARTS